VIFRLKTKNFRVFFLIVIATLFCTVKSAPLLRNKDFNLFYIFVFLIVDGISIHFEVASHRRAVISFMESWRKSFFLWWLQAPVGSLKEEKFCVKPGPPIDNISTKRFDIFSF